MTLLQPHILPNKCLLLDIVSRFGDSNCRCCHIFRNHWCGAGTLRCWWLQVQKRSAIILDVISPTYVGCKITIKNWFAKTNNKIRQQKAWRETLERKHLNNNSTTQTTFLAQYTYLHEVCLLAFAFTFCVQTKSFGWNIN